MNVPRLIGFVLYALIVLVLAKWIGIIDWRGKAERSEPLPEKKPQQSGPPAANPGNSTVTPQQTAMSTPPSETHRVVPLPSPPMVPPADIAAGQDDIQQMIKFAMTRGGMSNEEEILAVKRRLEARKPLRRDDPGVRHMQQQARTANEMGRRALQESRVTDAVQAFRTAYIADPLDVEIINNLGYAYLFQGDLQTAELWLLRALVLSPGRYIAWLNLGHVYAAQGNLKAGMACFANAYRFAARKETMLKSLEGMARDNGNDQVREAARQALQLQLMQAGRN